MAKFHCIHCGQRIDAPVELAGTDANCPTCGGAITVPALPHTTAPSTPPPLPAREAPQHGCMMGFILRAVERVLPSGACVSFWGEYI